VSAAGESAAPPATRLQLEVVAGNAAGTTIDVDERLVFGRQTEGSGQLAEDPELSRHHAEIARRPSGEYQLEDLSSTNGTCVNGTRLTEPTVLSLGDAIELGTTKLVVRALLAAAAPGPGAVDVRAATAITDVPAAARTPAPPPPPSPPPPLDLRLRVDLERAEAEVTLGEGQSVRLRLQEGRWQLVDGDSR
jgi:pSer/pThr/pTyr-binding forkhead associated (FHA) protein